LGVPTTNEDESNYGPTNWATGMALKRMMKQLLMPFPFVLVWASMIAWGKIVVVVYPCTAPKNAWITTHIV
jgi:hypothetical protein